MKAEKNQLKSQNYSLVYKRFKQNTKTASLNSPQKIDCLLIIVIIIHVLLLLHVLILLLLYTTII